VAQNTMYEDSRSATLLETNGRESAGKRSRHLNIRMFFITDQVNKGNIEIAYCPTDDMTGDYMTKPLHGKKFEAFCNEIMNLPQPAQQTQRADHHDTNSDHASVGHQERVGSNDSKVPQSTTGNSCDDGWTVVQAKSRAKGRKNPR
jgi:hypothetical protein